MAKKLLIFDADVLFVEGEVTLRPDAFGILTLDGFSNMFIAMDDPEIGRDRIKALSAGRWFNSHSVPNSRDYGAGFLHSLAKRLYEDVDVKRPFFVGRNNPETALPDDPDFPVVRVLIGKYPLDPLLGAGGITTYRASSLSDAQKIILEKHMA